jgi:hypothetical protein
MDAKRYDMKARTLSVRLVCLLSAIAFSLAGCAQHGSDDATAGTIVAAGPTAAPSGPDEVKTVAGSGYPGIADGPASSATFLMPSGLARGKDGTLYIADEAAQRIRTLSPGGRVGTLAGSGPVEPPGLSVKGGFLDGPAGSARFNRPQGLAVGPDGSLYVADERNACVRRIAHNQVTTVAGVCDRRGNEAGPEAGRLSDPRALAFDDRGNLYIADYGVGVLRLGRDGHLNRVKLTTGEKQILGLSVVTDPAGGSTLIASSPSIFIIQPLSGGVGAVSNIRNYAEGNRPFGDPYQFVPRNAREFFFSDIRSDTVRYLRLPAPPFVTTVFTRTIAGGTAERPIDNAGFRDGTREDSRFNAPSGLALDGNTLYVADTGNRRIRAIGLPATRLSETGLGTGIKPDSNHYEIAYVGASWAFWDSLGEDSFCAHLEKYMNESHKFSKPVRCHPIRIDAAGLPQMEDYIKNVLADERFDEILINMTPGAANAIFPNNAPPSAAAGAAGLRAHIESLLKVLAPEHTKLAIAWTFEPDDVSNTENLYERQQSSNGHALPGELINSLQDFKLEYDGAKALPITEYDEYADAIAHAKSSDPAPLYGTDDSHMSARGEDFLAKRVARALSGS